MKIVRLTYKPAAFVYLICLFQLFLLGGCIKENRDHCPNHLLFITASDILTDEDITETDSFGRVVLYLFNNNRHLVKSIDVTTEQINSRIPINITNMGLENGHAVIWANVDDYVALPGMDGNLRQDYIDLYECSLSLRENTLSPDYHSSPPDLLYGYGLLSVSTPNSVVSDEVNMKRKNGRLNITVRGIEMSDDADDYFFKITANNSGYDFLGTPIRAEKKPLIYEKGVWIKDVGYTTPSPCNIIHSYLDKGVREEIALQVHLMKNDSDILQAKEIIATNTDDKGSLITIEPGRTTNVLMQVDGTGALTIEVIITPWNEIYQWDEW